VLFKGRQDDLLIYHEIEKLHCVKGASKQSGYHKLLRLYERSLDTQMRDFGIRLSMLDRVQDPETLKILAELQQFLQRLTGVSGVQIMFNQLWLRQGEHNMDTRITDWATAAKKIVAEKMFVWAENIIVLAKNTQFKQAGEKYAALKKASITLQHDGLEHVIPATEPPVTVNIKKKLDEAERCITEQLIVAVTKYKEMDLRGFVDDPPEELFSRLKEASKCNDNIVAVMNSLEKVILAKFNAAMTIVQDACDPESELLKYACRAMRTLPRELQCKVRPKLEDAKHNIEAQQALQRRLQPF